MALNYSLLIVDPDNEIKSSIRSIVGDEFDIKEILTASSGQEALGLLSSHKSIDCLITNAQLDDNSGFSLISDIKQNRNFYDMSILLMSDKKDPEHILRAAACGASDLILKPLNPRALALKLKKLISGRKIRKFERISTIEAFDIEIGYGDKLTYNAKLLDISKGGCSVRSEPFTIGGRVYDKVNLDISDNSGKNVLTVDAELIRIERDPESEDNELKKILVAFQFDSTMKQNISKIEDFLVKFVDKNGRNNPFQN